MGGLEHWAGEHARSGRLFRVALWRLPDTADVRRVGSLVRSTIEALALEGQTDEAERWLAWGPKHCPDEFSGKDWLSAAILFAREGRKQEALASLKREPEPLLTSGRGQLVARTIRAFASDQPEPLHLKEVRYLGSTWPEMAAFIDEVELRMAEISNASAG
jgi:hypothetical protein